MRDIEDMYLFLILLVFVSLLFPLAFTAIVDAAITNPNSVIFDVLAPILVVLFLCIPIGMIIAWRGSL